MDLDEQALSDVWEFKPVAEQVVQKELSDQEYLMMLARIGIEKMAEDVIHPRESSTLWETILLMLRRDPEDFAEFMLETLGESDDGSASDRWGRYIG